MTATDKPAINSTVRRLSALQGWPFEDEGKVAVVQAFLDAFPGLAEIEACVDELLRPPERRCPSPPEVYELAVTMRSRVFANLRMQQECPDCENTSWRTIYRMGRAYDENGQELRVLLSGVERCSCPLGQAMKGAAA